MSNSPDDIQREIDQSREDAARKIDQIGTHLHDATHQARETMNQEVPGLLKEGLDTAKTELKEDAAKVAAGSAGIAGAAVLGGVAGIYLLQAVMELLAERVPRWQAAAIVTLGLAGAAAALGLSGKEQLRPEKLKPKRTMSAVQQTMAWTKTRAKSLRSTAAAPSSVSAPDTTAHGV